MPLLRRRRGEGRRLRAGRRIVQDYVYAAIEENPTATEDQVANIVKANIESDFEDRPILKLLLDLFAEFLPLIKDLLQGAASG